MSARRFWDVWAVETLDQFGSVRSYESFPSAEVAGARAVELERAGERVRRWVSLADRPEYRQVSWFVTREGVRL